MTTKSKVNLAVRMEVDNFGKMHDHLWTSFNQLEDKSGVDMSRVKFFGFDANNEWDHLTYGGSARGAINSHSQRVPLYRRMYEVYGYMPKDRPLTRDEIIRVLSVDLSK